ncbi:hypothetical protein [Pseudomonas sp. 5P_3.1_Bac2]|uniref:hypothetical protein n=1 Tax=Pseudomonas sp. 5P_3.1_Bac2 TaxID=2971617 RepID=UPI0021C6C3B3|nr:hypothetical protein [Pseudomonas sp. 5P_3.1_Bac2]MCU1717870.1 hypothetical protein [Pseudomonas sp. 5P_3.1_Bac2]
MPSWVIPRAFICLVFAMLSACTPQDSNQAALEEAVSQLQKNLQGKRASAVMEQLHPQFLAQQQYDRAWAQRSMLALFMRHKRVQIITLSKTTSLDGPYSERGLTEARVALTGAQNLLPNSAEHLQLKMQWWLEQGQWRLARLDWQ